MADVRGGGSDPLAVIEAKLAGVINGLGMRELAHRRLPDLEEIASELAGLRGRLAETERHAGMDVTNGRIMEAHSAMLAEWLPRGGLEKLHFEYKQGHDERCYICVLVARAEALRVERDTAVDALRTIAGPESPIWPRTTPAVTQYEWTRQIAREALAAVGGPTA